jgi:hypothetical protein
VTICLGLRYYGERNGQELSDQNAWQPSYLEQVSVRLILRS